MARGLVRVRDLAVMNDRDELLDRISKLAAKHYLASGMLHDLLARIHRDDGHYTVLHGIDKSYLDAHERVVRLYLERDVAVRTGQRLLQERNEARLALHRRIEADRRALDRSPCGSGGCNLAPNHPLPHRGSCGCSNGCKAWECPNL